MTHVCQDMFSEPSSPTGLLRCDPRLAMLALPSIDQAQSVRLCETCHGDASDSTTDRQMMLRHASEVVSAEIHNKGCTNQAFRSLIHGGGLPI